MNRSLTCAIALTLALGAGCSDDEDLDSDTEAELAYLGLDNAIDKAINLGFDGFNAASSANIPVQSDVGDAGGTIDVGGQVDQGSSANKEMRLEVTLVDYTDGTVTATVDDEERDFEIEYDTADGEPLLIDLSLRSIPDGTFTGTVLGTLDMIGDVEASADFELTLSGEIQPDPNMPEDIVRTPGTLTITGTATSGDGVFNVDVTK